MGRTRSFDKRLSAALVVLGVAALVVGDLWWLRAAAAAAFLAAGLASGDPRRSGKKKLVMTARATRMHLVALGLGVVLSAAVAAWATSPLPCLLIAQFPPFGLVAATFLLRPAEARVQGKFYREAEEKLRRLAPVIVGVTGSYGKTSVKHILGHILDMGGCDARDAGEREYRDGDYAHRAGAAGGAASLFRCGNGGVWAGEHCAAVPAGAAGFERDHRDRVGAL